MPRKSAVNEEQSELKNKIGGWAKGFSTLCLVLRIFLYIGIGCLVLVLLALPVGFKAVKIEDNRIKINDKVIEYNVNEDKIASITIDGKEYSLKGSDVFKLGKENITNENLNNIRNVLINGLVVGITVMVLTAIGLRKIGKLLKRIKEEEKVFVKGGNESILFVMKLNIAIWVVTVVGAVVSSIFISTDSSIGINVGYLVTILVLYFLSLIYKYGENIEE